MLEIEGLVHITMGDGPSVDVSADGSHLRAEIGSWRVERPTLRLVRTSYVLVRRLAAVLERERLTLTVTRDGSPVVELGAGVATGLAARLFRIPRVRFYRRT